MSHDAEKKPAAPEKGPEAAKDVPKSKKKSLPTNCAQCNTRIRRKKWYYHNGGYYCGKKCAITHWRKRSTEKQKKAEAAPAAKAETTAETPKPA